MKQDKKNILYGFIILIIGGLFCYNSYTYSGIDSFVVGLFIITVISALWISTDSIINLLTKGSKDIIYKENFKIYLMQILVGISLFAFQKYINNLDTSYVLFAALLLVVAGIYKSIKWLSENSEAQKESRAEKLIELNDERNKLIALKASQAMNKDLLAGVLMMIVFITFWENSIIIYSMAILATITWDRSYKQYYEKFEKEM